MKQHQNTPLREAVMDGHTHDVGGATLWLAGAAVAMIVALYFVQISVISQKMMRRKTQANENIQCSLGNGPCCYTLSPQGLSP